MTNHIPKSSPAFINGMDLCEQFFHEIAEPLLTCYFPELRYSAGLLGYGSDVLGFDDTVSTDHMWGPRFYLFLDSSDISQKDHILLKFSEEFPCTYRGYSVNFSAPDPNDHGVKHPVFITQGKVSPLIPKKLEGIPLQNSPLIATLSEVSNFTVVSDKPECQRNIRALYPPVNSEK